MAKRKQARTDAEIIASAPEALDVAIRLKGMCQWFALCTRESVTTVPHPILGDVPCCAKCAAFATKP